MDKRIKNKWLKALRSGEYEQGKGYLCEAGKDGTQKFCCLGVLINETEGFDFLPGDPPVEGVGISHDFAVKHAAQNYRTMVYMPSRDFNKRVGLEWGMAEALSDMNDEGRTFAEIADYIEENL